MSNEEYKLLENLLGKLQSEIKYKFSMIPEYIQDMYCFVIFDNETGKKIKTYINPTIKECVEEILNEK